MNFFVPLNVMDSFSIGELIGELLSHSLVTIDDEMLEHSQIDQTERIKLVNCRSGDFRTKKVD